MTSSDVVALVSLVVSPTAALAAVWLTSRLAAERTQRDQEDKARGDALTALGHFYALLMDAQPSLIINGDLREYESREEAVAGLYDRWRTSREPLMVLAVAHTSKEARELAFKVQAYLEHALRESDDVIKCKNDNEQRRSFRRAEDAWAESARDLDKLGQLLSPFKGWTMPG
jgi:hypothetical protein